MKEFYNLEELPILFLNLVNELEKELSFPYVFEESTILKDLHGEVISMQPHLLLYSTQDIKELATYNFKNKLLGWISKDKTLELFSLFNCVYNSALTCQFKIETLNNKIIRNRLEPRWKERGAKIAGEIVNALESIKSQISDDLLNERQICDLSWDPKKYKPIADWVARFLDKKILDNKFFVLEKSEEMLKLVKLKASFKEIMGRHDVLMIGEYHSIATYCRWILKDLDWIKANKVVFLLESMMKNQDEQSMLIFERERNNLRCDNNNVNSEEAEYSLLVEELIKYKVPVVGIENSILQKLQWIMVSTLYRIRNNSGDERAYLSKQLGLFFEQIKIKFNKAAAVHASYNINLLNMLKNLKGLLSELIAKLNSKRDCHEVLACMQKFYEEYENVNRLHRDEANKSFSSRVYESLSSIFPNETPKVVVITGAAHIASFAGKLPGIYLTLNGVVGNYLKIGALVFSKGLGIFEKGGHLRPEIKPLNSSEWGLSEDRLTQTSAEYLLDED